MRYSPASGPAGPNGPPRKFARARHRSRHQEGDAGVRTLPILASPDTTAVFGRATLHGRFTRSTVRRRARPVPSNGLPKNPVITKPDKNHPEGSKGSCCENSDKCATVAFWSSDRLGMRRRKCRNAPFGAFSVAPGAEMHQTMHFAGGRDRDGPPICASPVAPPDVVSLRISMQGGGAGLEVTWRV